ncbi:sulfurtransferase TusA family protein [Radicibacter daui]|uniref:sulfurtransferase TusA family protein n=1 Tax=Radicibacter daui TaxID=3064829 RepID=UPI00404699FF
MTNDKNAYFLDITAEICPMTFVRTKLLIERMPAGSVCEVLLKGEEPLTNVPASVAELGHQVVSIEKLDERADEEAIWRLVVQKKDNFS